MFEDPLFILAAIAALAVLGVLLTGILVFAKGGEANRKYGNKLMQLRIAAQAVAVVLILIFVLVRQSGG